MGYKIVLTCDRTMASTYHGNMFFGFSACLPQGVLPDWFYYPVFCPSGPANENGSLNAKVFISLGADESEKMLDGYNRMLEVLKKRAYKGLELEYYLFQDESHMSVFPAAFTKGLISIYKP